jgi:uncharacterized protein (TIGR00369 family)
MTTKTWNPALAAVLRQLMEDDIPFNRFLGMRLLELDDGFARVELPFKPELIGDPRRPAIHGGVLSTLIDTCGGAAAFTQIVPPETVSTIDLRVDYLRPGESKPLVCESTVSRMGNRVASVDSRIFHPDAPERLVATGKAVYNVKRAKDRE